MKIGIGVTNFSWPCPPDQIGPIITRIATTADAAGVDSIWTMDHFFQIRLSGLPPESPMLEAYATLAFIAGRTRQIRLGTLVTAVPNRHPGVLIKAVTSLDVLTGGRIVLGVGAGAPFTVTRDGEAGGLRVLREHCQEAGRDYDEIEKTTATAIDLGEGRRDGLRRLVDHLRALADIGIDHALLSPQRPWDDETLGAVASIVPEVHAIPVAAAPH